MHITLWFMKKHVKNKIKIPVSKCFLVFFKVGNWIHPRQKWQDEGTIKQERYLKSSCFFVVWFFLFLSRVSLKTQIEEIFGILLYQNTEDASNDKAAKNLEARYFSANTIEFKKQLNINWIIHAYVY